MSLKLIAAMMMAAGMVCVWCFILEVIQGRLTLASKWKDLTVDQWVLFVGSFLVPIGLIGLGIF